MVSIRTLPEDKSSSTSSSIGSVPTEVLHPEDEDFDLDLPPYPLGFSRFPVFPPRWGDLVLNVSNDELVVDGETDEQRQQREQRNADRAQRRADEERQLAPSADSSTRHQAPTWPSSWQTWIAFPMPPNIRTFGPIYGRIWSRPWDRPLLYSKGFKPSPIRRSPPTRLSTAAPHHDPVGTVIAVHLPIIEGRTLDATTAVSTRAVTASRGTYMVLAFLKIHFSYRQHAYKLY